MNFVNSKTASHPFELEKSSSDVAGIFLISIDMVPPEFYRPESDYARHLNVPNMRSLAKDGVLFTNNFATSPLCGPSRASYLTGRYPYLTVNEERSHDGHAISLKDEDVIFPEYLKAAGFRTRHIGKCHVGTELFLRAFGENDSPWNRWAPPVTDDDGYRSYCRNLGVKPMQFKKEICGLAPDGRSKNNSYGGWIEQIDGADYPIEATYPWFLANKAVNTLVDNDPKTTGQKIYLQLDFFAPHQPYMIPAGFEERAEQLKKIIKLPESYKNCLKNPPKTDIQPMIYDLYRRRWGICDPDTARDYILANLLQMEVIDKALGCFIGKLKELGLYDSSLICFLGDHGEMNTESALIDKGVYGHPKVARAPLTVKFAENKYSGQIVDKLTSLLDVAPTILKTAGIQPYERLDGQNLEPLVSDQEMRRKNPLIFECFWHVAPNPAVSLIAETDDDSKFMYTENLTSEINELYNLEDFSFQNLIEDDSAAEYKREMVEKMAETLRNDSRWVPYWHAFKVRKFEQLQFVEEDDQMFIPQ